MKHKLRRKTLLFIFWTFIGLLVWDGYLLYEGGSIETISYGMWDYAQKYPQINSICSILIGHFFWPIKARDYKPEE